MYPAQNWNTAPDAPIVVGVDGSPDSVRGLRFAVAEAVRSHSEVWLVHAIHEAVPFAPMWPMLTSERLTDAGRELLAETVRLAEDLSQGQVKYRQLTSLGPAGQVLTSAAEQAQLVVLGHRTVGVVQRIFTGSTTLGVVARARCPVVSVPHEWDHERRHDRLVAAIDGSTASSSVLERAFAGAQARSARLDVVHCWRLDPYYSYLIDEWSVRQEWNRQTQGTISDLVETWALRYPDVEMQTQMEYSETADALVRCSQDADMMYIGRHGHGRLGAQISMTNPGSITRALLHHAHCPLEVVPVSLPAPTSAEDPTAEPSVSRSGEDGTSGEKP